MYRQGDVLLIAMETLPSADLAVVADHGRTVLAYGEVTGHAHVIDGRDATLWEAGDGARFLEAKRACSLLHEEHDPIELPAGTYWVIRQVEYSPTEITRSRPIED